MSSLLSGFKHHERRALAQAISLIESSKAADRSLVLDLLAKLPKAEQPCIRLGISGPPGVGKSSLINLIGQKLLKKNFRVAILAIDPSSEVHHGSILADKTRMGELLNQQEIYIRPSSSGGALGGITASTKDTIYALESFGFNFTIIETLGVGQSETLAFSLVDHFLVLLQPGAGDHLQALKKGLLERADFLAVNKYDGEFKSLAQATFNSLKAQFLLSAVEDFGIDNMLNTILASHEQLLKNNQLITRRQQRLQAYVNYVFDQHLLSRLKERLDLSSPSQQLVKDIAHGDALRPHIEQLVSSALAAVPD